MIDSLVRKQIVMWTTHNTAYMIMSHQGHGYDSDSVLALRYVRYRSLFALFLLILILFVIPTLQPKDYDKNMEKLGIHCLFKYNDWLQLFFINYVKCFIIQGYSNLCNIYKCLYTMISPNAVAKDIVVVFELEIVL